MFEWDEAKRQKNLEKHCVDFRDVSLIFDGRPVVHIPSHKNKEARCASVAGSKRDFTQLFGRGEPSGGGSYRLGGREMARKEHIMKYTTEELDKLVKKDGSRSDWEKTASMTKADIEAAVASDPDEADMVMDWDNATAELPKPKAILNMRIDRDVLEYFRKTGKGYQTLINAVLRSYVKRKDQHHNHD